MKEKFYCSWLNLCLLTKEQREILTLNYSRWINKTITSTEFAKLLNLNKQLFREVIQEYDAMV
ncbi:hypothetical protein P4668_17355 [Priestia megaterium]|jgi:hypothetical protein|uniref:hypothetical protein n=1 Tax=Priestia megaterium TaxID=1404 RepID=UPI001DF3C717|nr:hypothetical protein [Priestia megaterium]MED4134159.1 hypothetical protein [Priestia megaterium]MED4213401.1 hypothetical protein [Priestia megaterium]CAH0312815.1 hypothetical protein SRABI82_05018 [Priestia megaterium]